MTKSELPVHLDRRGIIETGAFYTPQSLVDEVGRLIRPYTIKAEHPIIFDNAVGGGAFTQLIGGSDYRLADCDLVSCEKLRESTELAKIFHSNSLHNVSRTKYDIPESAFLIQVGNPPYNDTTSAYKKGEKGENVCDEDLRDRDLGISFLRSFDKLRADVVCVLHPLAYLIKEANFKRLKGFRENYRLCEATIFSSELFAGTGSAKFPIVVGLYERHLFGMDFASIRAFAFRVLNSDREFRIDKFQTTDAFIRKYPPPKGAPTTSALGLYYYTFRDINSLLRSASFQLDCHYNAIPVTLETLYQYSYLFAFKQLFKPPFAWLYGNLSPLFDSGFVNEYRSEFVEFALARHPAFQKLGVSVIESIRHYYSIDHSASSGRISTIEHKLQSFFESLV